MRVGIIGGGIAGLTLARQLVRAGHSATIVDKGGGLGGRASTRRSFGVAFDHGAAYFTVRDPDFLAFLHDHVPDESWAPWAGRFASWQDGQLTPEEPPSTRFVGVPGMSALGRAIGKGLDSKILMRVDRLTGSPGQWILVDEDRTEHGPFDWVVATAPPAQSAGLLDGLTPIAAEVSGVVMQPCFAVMAAPPVGTELPFDGIRCQHPVLGWAANEHSKPGRVPGPAVVIHSNHDWAKAHLNEDHPSIALDLFQAARDAFGVDLEWNSTAVVHRWLYAKPAEPLGQTCLVDHAARLAACGDWCLAAKIEGAFSSGNACAEAILGQSSN